MKIKKSGIVGIAAVIAVIFTFIGCPDSSGNSGDSDGFYDPYHPGAIYTWDQYLSFDNADNAFYGFLFAIEAPQSQSYFDRISRTTSMKIVTAIEKAYNESDAQTRNIFKEVFKVNLYRTDTHIPAPDSESWKNLNSEKEGFSDQFTFFKPTDYYWVYAGGYEMKWENEKLILTGEIDSERYILINPIYLDSLMVPVNGKPIIVNAVTDLYNGLQTLGK